MRADGCEAHTPPETSSCRALPGVPALRVLLALPIRHHYTCTSASRHTPPAPVKRHIGGIIMLSSKRSLMKVLALAVLLAAGTAHAASRFVLISHAPDSDSWWNTIKNSIKQAGEDYSVTVDYRN